MSTRALDRALDALEGRPVPARKVPVTGGVPSAVVTLSGATREEFATDTLRIMGVLSEQITEIRGRKGSLAGHELPVQPLCRGCCSEFRRARSCRKLVVLDELSGWPRMGERVGVRW